MEHPWLYLAAIALYFLPWLEASCRGKRNKAAIGLVNLILWLDHYRVGDRHNLGFTP